MDEFLTIDGSFLEGGGQILRNALSLSCILRKPIRIVNIRANRPNPGLSNQHLYGLNLLQEITNAKVNGNTMKSTSVEFNPGPTKAGHYRVDTKTAASITLVMQAALPVLIFGSKESSLELIGGTNVGMAPQVDTMSEVLRPNLECFGVTFDLDLIQRGYYPRGGGKCAITVHPVREVNCVDLTKFGKLTEVVGWSYVAGRLPLHLAVEMKRNAERELQKIGAIVEVEAYQESAEVAKDNGAGIILKATTDTGCTVGSSALGDKRVDAKALGEKAGKDMCKILEAKICVDEYIQDQLIIYMALAAGESKIMSTKLTNHTRTAIHVAELMTGVKFQVTAISDDNVVITCKGIGIINKNVNN